MKKCKEYTLEDVQEMEADGYVACDVRIYAGNRRVGGVYGSEFSLAETIHRQIAKGQAWANATRLQTTVQACQRVLAVFDPEPGGDFEIIYLDDDEIFGK